MKYKIFSIIGILTYVLSVVTSVTDNDGNYPLSSLYLYLFFFVSIIYTIIVIYNLWYTNKVISVLFFIVTIDIIIFSLYNFFVNPIPNMPILIVSHTSNAIRAIMIWFTIVTFWRKKSTNFI